MQYDLVIKRTLRDAQGILRANLPQLEPFPMIKQSNPSAPLCVHHKSDRRWSMVTTPLFASCSVP
jgi:hypothetical protein